MSERFDFQQRIIIALLVVVMLTGCPGKQDAAAPGKPAGMPPVPVQTGFAVSKDVPVDIRAIGNVEPIASVAIKAQVGGELIGVSFEEGQEVKKGDLLFSIQPRLYATQLAQAEANLARDRADATNARLALLRQTELDRKGAGVKEELDKARATSESANAVLRADEALVLIAQTQVGYTTVKAPMDGRTGAIRLRPGNLIKVGDDAPLTTIVQLAPIYVTFALPERYLADVRRGQRERAMSVTASDPRSAKSLGEGELTFISNTVDATTGTITIKATFPNAENALWPGAFVDVLLHLDMEKAATMVPASAITVGQRGSQLYVVKADGSAELRAVKTGRTVAQETVIKEGVEVGEKVVVNGQSRLMPGAKVVEKPIPAAPAAKVPAKTSSFFSPQKTGQQIAQQTGRVGERA